MDSIRSAVALLLGSLIGGLFLRAPVYAVGCTEAPPYVCTTTSETFFYGITHGQPLRIIDFETLPNGQPSVGGTQITPSFNYTSWGVTFSAPIGLLRIGGSLPGQHDLNASTTIPGTHTWIRADFVHPSNAVGIWFPGATTLTVFDDAGSAIASQAYGASGGPWFIGIYSEIPIAYATIDRGSTSETIDDFIFSLVPEPTTAFLLAVGVALVNVRRVPRQ